MMNKIINILLYNCFFLSSHLQCVSKLILKHDKIKHRQFWCEMNCPEDTKHTMCIYDEDPTTANCWNIHNQMNPTTRKRILNWHNKLRDDVAGGILGKKASYMLLMSWDFDMEDVATRWAYQCLRTNDECRVTDRYEDVSQNIGWTSIPENQNDPPSAEMILQQWRSTKREFYNRQKLKYENYQSKINPFTRMVRACLEKIGCGEVVYQQGEARRRFLVCNYAPSECHHQHFENDTMSFSSGGLFPVGKPCSNCPPGMDCYTFDMNHTHICQHWPSFEEKELKSPLEIINEEIGHSILSVSSARSRAIYDTCFITVLILVTHYECSCV